MNVANPSLSQRPSHQAIVTRLPNHCGDNSSVQTITSTHLQQMHITQEAGKDVGMYNALLMWGISSANETATQ